MCGAAIDLSLIPEETLYLETIYLIDTIALSVEIVVWLELLIVIDQFGVYIAAVGIETIR